MLIQDLLLQSAAVRPDAEALGFKDQRRTYGELAADTARLGAGLLQLGLAPRDRVAIWLPKQIETVQAIFATARAGGVFVPVNPVLKPAQVIYQLEHSDARVLVTSRQRFQGLAALLADRV